ncbi:class IIb bacteriocin, lactobin A/cerein 7B family [Aerococcus urinaeequi]|uniref:class IIb bacteriocin, lactobin A/cerein 7B family n=1 Tax=Aerococcus urinaeequi TaxID=51665 RepID=UPI003ADEE718
MKKLTNEELKNINGGRILKSIGKFVTDNINKRAYWNSYTDQQIGQKWSKK